MFQLEQQKSREWEIDFYAKEKKSLMKVDKNLELMNKKQSEFNLLSSEIPLLDE